MSITKWYITGDTHSDFSRFEKSYYNLANNSLYGIIILGDCGLNFYLNKTDYKKKEYLNKTYPNLIFYCVRGNHEARPETIETMKQVFDEDVCGPVFMEDEFPNIRYFKDGCTYEINGHRTLVIGGAYSVDKWYRLNRAGLTEETNDPAKSGWFNNELLTEDEMLEIASVTFGKQFDFVFTHTCPLSWEPTDLFLSFIDQSTVDKSMEQWLDVIKADIHWGVWCFGHFHEDRIERPRVEQFYRNIEDLETVWNRWFDDETIKEEWWLKKSPHYHMEESN